MNEDWDIDSAVASLRSELSIAKRTLSEISAQNPTHLKEQALGFCLARAVDIAEGCANVAGARLPWALSTLVRSLYETFLYQYWCAQSDANAERFSRVGVNLMKRDLKKNLQAGYASIRHRTDGSDRTAELLANQEMQNADQAPRFAVMAREAGLERIHTMLYGMWSMFSHGSLFGLTAHIDADKAVYSEVCAAASLLECTQAVARSAVLDGNLIPVSSIYSLLGLSGLDVTTDMPGS